MTDRQTEARITIKETYTYYTYYIHNNSMNIHMEDLNHKQGITELVRCSSSSSGEGRLAMGPPDPSTTLGWRERGQGREDSMVVGTGRGLSPSHLGWATATDGLMSLRVPSISSTSTAETLSLIHI